jgi:putative transposase
MSGRARRSIGGIIYHVLNRANARATLFKTHGDYEAFERVLTEAQQRQSMRILAYCVIPNHWHFALWPREDGELPQFMWWLAGTHAHRWRIAHRTIGMGHVYQDRYKSFPVQDDAHLLLVCRYVERNALAARLVQWAEQWRWSSPWRRVQGDERAMALLARWPLRPSRLQHWLELLNQPQSEKELQATRRSIERGAPLGDDSWCSQIAEQLELEWTLRPRRRPGRTRR